eukprot:1832668-Amphidinium_carterae.1
MSLYRCAGYHVWPARNCDLLALQTRAPVRAFGAPVLSALAGRHVAVEAAAAAIAALCFVIPIGRSSRTCGRPREIRITSVVRS